MPKQVGYVRATGTVDGDTNFYYDELWGYLVRMLPGVSSKRFWKDPACKGVYCFLFMLL
jgi:hypothetical protein